MVLPADAGVFRENRYSLYLCPTAAAAAAFLAGAPGTGRDRSQTQRRSRGQGGGPPPNGLGASERGGAGTHDLKHPSPERTTMLGTEKRRKVAMLTDLADKVADQSV